MSERKYNPNEYRARYLKIEDIPSDTLAYRAENGIRKSLVMATAGAHVFSRRFDGALDAGLKKDTMQILSAVNYSASQCRKELARRKRG